MCGFGLAIQTTLPFWICFESFFKYFLAFLVFRTRKSCQKSHFGIKMQLSEPKTDFSSYKAKSMARSPSRRVRDPGRHRTVSARRAASKNRVQKFWNRVLKTSNRKTAPEALKPYCIERSWFSVSGAFFVSLYASRIASKRPIYFLVHPIFCPFPLHPELTWHELILN